MKQRKIRKWILVTTVTLVLSSVVAHVFSTENRAERAAKRVADAVCVFREQNARWPNDLSELPADVTTEFGDVAMQYDQTELTVTVPVSIVDVHHAKNLWSRITGRNMFSRSETSSISVYIKGRYINRHPDLFRQSILEGVPLNIDRLEKTKKTEQIGAH